MEAPVSVLPSKEEFTESIKINQGNNKYLLIIKINTEIMALTLRNLEEMDKFSYSRKFNLNEIKEINQAFRGLNSLNEFVEFLKGLSEINKLLINKKEDKLCLIFEIEFLLKTQKVEIFLCPEKINFETVVNELCKEINLMKETTIKNLENENKVLKKDIENLKNENINLKEEIKQIKNILEPINKKFLYKKSAIMEENEFNFIHTAIKQRMDKEVKKMKKLYQASIDGDDANIFHSKCDNIPNTLTIIKSAGNRRFGGFTTQVWDLSSGFKNDAYAFLFSLDKQKIYKCKNNHNAIWTYKNYGPIFGRSHGGIFGNSHDICLGQHPLKSGDLHTYEFGLDPAYDYSGDDSALSECGSVKSSVCALEYEVFQIIF